MKRLLVAGLCLAGWTAPLLAQVPDVLMTTMPRDSQLYARNPQSNRATVPLSGTVRNAGFDSLILRVTRDGGAYTNVTQTLVYTNGQAPFTISASIAAEFFNYGFKLYVVQGINEFQVAVVNSVVAGDAFLINGQSNAEAIMYSGSASANQHAYLRSFGAPAASGAADLTWRQAIGDTRYGAGMVGQWGLRFGRLLINTYQIPIAIINAAEPSKEIFYFQRNNSNPIDLNTNYGRLLYRVQQAGLTNGIRAIFWYQGESDWHNSPNNPANHENGFLTMYQNWLLDYPSVEKIYVHQVREVAVVNKWTEGLDLRNRQRLFQDTQSKISVMSTTGIDGYGVGSGALHYAYTGGYEVLGSNAFNIVRRDLYGGPSANIEPPNILYACFNNPAHNEIALVMRNTTDTLTWGNGAQNDLAVNGSTNAIVSGSISNNAVILKLTAAVNYGATISYAGHTANTAPWIRNAGGVGLLAFYNAPVITTPALSSQNVTASASNGSTNLTLAFNTVLGQRYSVESCTNLSNPQWQTVFPLSWGAGSSRQVTVLVTNIGCFYRLRVVKPD